MTYPEKFKYTKDHEWVVLEDGKAKVGITDFAQSELGEVVFVELPETGREFKKGDSVCVVESTKAASDVYTPVSGKVVEVNTSLSNDSSLINSDPHDSGWMVILEDVNEAELADLMSAGEYEQFVS